MGRHVASVVYAALAVTACGGDNNNDDELRQGGDTTVTDRSQGAFMHAAANLGMTDQETFQEGTSPFDFHWEAPQLGPLYNNDSCFGCHGSFGRGLSQIGSNGALTDINGPQSEALVRTSFATGSADPANPGGPIPVPGYGTQLQDHATNGLPKAFIDVSWDEHDAMYGDGTTVSLRQPMLAIRAGNSEPLPAGMLFSYRIAPQLIGMGLLMAVDPTANPDGSGAMNMVWDPEQMATVPGRLGWKANTATLHLQAAAAGANDMGLSNEVFPDPDGTHDIADDQFEQLVFFITTIAVPAGSARDATATHGRALFDQFGCSSCHTPTQVTGDAEVPELAHQTIHPWTDLELHDMGSGLDDGREDFMASGRQWRTPALWGLGLATTVTPGVTFLHDGRARTFEEAIMWHGGDAAAAQAAFAAAAKSDRDALVAFLGTL